MFVPIQWFRSTQHKYTNTNSCFVQLCLYRFNGSDLHNTNIPIRILALYSYVCTDSMVQIYTTQICQYEFLLCTAMFVPIQWFRFTQHKYTNTNSCFVQLCLYRFNGSDLHNTNIPIRILALYSYVFYRFNGSDVHNTNIPIRILALYSYVCADSMVQIYTTQIYQYEFLLCTAMFVPIQWFRCTQHKYTNTNSCFVQLYLYQFNGSDVHNINIPIRILALYSYVCTKSMVQMYTTQIYQYQLAAAK